LPPSSLLGQTISPGAMGPDACRKRNVRQPIERACAASCSVSTDAMQSERSRWSHVRQACVYPVQLPAHFDIPSQISNGTAAGSP
jgi:hypothetical protein